MFFFAKKNHTIKIEDELVKKAIGKVIDLKTHYGFSGHPQVREFEQSISKRLGNVPLLGMNSGTDALIAALKVLGIGHGDEVIVPAFSFISTASCVNWVGANPVFADIGMEDYAIEPAKIEEKITSRTKAIIVAHLFGHPALGVAEIFKMAEKRGLALIEDAAQSFGAEIKMDGDWRKVGTIGHLGCLSFSSTKPFAAPGNGGAIIFRKGDPCYAIVDKARFYGAKVHYYDYPVVGINSKLHEVQAAALLAKLPFLDYWIEHRKRLADQYTKYLEGVGDLILPQEHGDAKRTWYRYVIRTKQRDPLCDYLARRAGAVLRLHPTKNYPVPLPYFAAFQSRNHKPGDFPVSEQASSQVLSLPITNFVSQDDANRIIEWVRAFFKE